MSSTIRARKVRAPAAAQALLRRVGRLADAQGLRAYAVGGCVRDWLLRLPTVAELDVAVQGDGIAFARALGRALRGRVQAHEQFGTATVLLGRRRLDIASCRQERYAKPAAYPKVSPGTLTQDLGRRDFTINAMAMELNAARFGALLDPHHGARDLRRNTLRVLHARSFLDDPSRILRGVRFAVRFGLRWDPETFAALQEAIRQGALGWLNAGRLHRELERMAAEPNPRACLEALIALWCDA
ncbi:MAG: CCA tRNA nucleotidyltransferase [Candidatus Omnitrophica bacterium]|nr:CCA tRNA nucleotidyltransferase [Candidatus Omnitrophota bacterium]